MSEYYKPALQSSLAPKYDNLSVGCKIHNEVLKYSSGIDQFFDINEFMCGMGVDDISWSEYYAGDVYAG